MLSSVTFGNFLNLSGPQFPALQFGDSSRAVSLQRLYELMHAKALNAMPGAHCALCKRGLLLLSQQSRASALKLKACGFVSAGRKKALEGSGASPQAPGKMRWAGEEGQ